MVPGNVNQKNKISLKINIENVLSVLPGIYYYLEYIIPWKLQANKDILVYAMSSYVFPDQIGCQEKNVKVYRSIHKNMHTNLELRWR